MYKFLVLTLLIIIIIIIVIYKIINCFINRDSFKNQNYNKNCICVLTKGYKNEKDYNMLIKRNKHILENVYAICNYPDIIIFHEGNITNTQQDYIQKRTPDLPLKFIIVNFDYNRFNTINEKVWRRRKGYKLMCDFWIHKFFNYTKSYNYLLRIDEDCFIKKCDNIFKFMIDNNIVFTYKKWDNDKDFVTKGMRDFSNNFIKNNKIIKKNNFKTEIPSGPYTNVFAINLKYFNNNLIIKKYIKEVVNSNNILIYRWGDLPLWGEILQIFVDNNRWKENNSINYYHGSHFTNV